jgi:hypothetical protein
VPGSRFFLHPVVQVVISLVGAPFSALVILATVKEGHWVLACAFGLAEVWFVYAVTTIKARRERAELMRSFINERGVSHAIPTQSGRAVRGLRLFRDFRAQERSSTRHRLGLSLMLSVCVTLALFVVAIARR